MAGRDVGPSRLFLCASAAGACARKSAAGLHKKALPDRAGRLEAALG